MNYCHLTYCLDRGTGGINMKSKKVKEFVGCFIEESNKPVAFLDGSSKLIRVNDAFYKHFQIKKMNNIRELLDDTSIEIWNKFIEIAKKTGNATFYIPIKIATGKLSIFDVFFLYAEKSNSLIARFSCPLLAERKIESPYSHAFYKSDRIMLFVDQNKIICDVNELCLSTFNANREDLIGKSMKELLSLVPDLYSQYVKHLKSAFINGSADFFCHYEHSNAELRHYHVTIIYNKETRMYLIRIADQTEKVNLEKQLTQKDTMSSIGELAASIAHEIRNPMTALKGFTQLLRASATEESKKYLTVIDDEIKRMESILSEMLLLSKPNTNAREIISLQKVVSSIIQVIHPKANLEGVVIIEEKCEAVSDSIYGDEGKLKQVFLNLMKNALEAMPSGGILTVTTKQSAGGDFVISIADTGKGIHEKQLEKIFTPYFTTRDDGTGLGLPFVLKTVEEQGGTIFVESEVGVGTQFMLSFPTVLPNLYGEMADERILTDSSRH